MKAVIAIACVAVFCSVGAASAQSSPHRFHVTPLAAHLHPVQSLPSLTAGGRSYAAALGSGLGAGLALDWRTPLAGIRLRASALRTTPELRVRQTEDGGETAPTTLDLLAADVLVGLPGAWRAHPFLVLGAGVKRYDFSSQGSSPVDPASTYGAHASRSTLHLGAGIDWRIGRFLLAVEAASYESSFPPADPGQLGGSSPQHDIVTSLGLRIPIF